MTHPYRVSGWALVVSAPARFAERGGSAWTTVSSDAQRTASVCMDPKISVDTLLEAGLSV